MSNGTVSRFSDILLVYKLVSFGRFCNEVKSFVLFNPRFILIDSVTKNGDEIKAHDERLRSQNETAASSAQEQLNRHEKRLEKVEAEVDLLLSE